MAEHVHIPQQVNLALGVVPEDPDDADPALVDAVRRDTLDALRKDGYSIEHPYSGQRGGFPVDLITGLTTAATHAWAQKEVILADTSTLVTILTPVVLVARHLRAAYEKRAGKDAAQQAPIKITLEIEGATTSVEAADLETAEAALKLARRFRSQHPAVAAKVNPQSKAKAMASVPRSQPRKRR